MPKKQKSKKKKLGQQHIAVVIGEREIITGIGLFLFAFFVYLKTAAPTITFSDSGDFITCAYTLGIAHPTGYPLWTMLGHLSCYLPLANIAFRVNLFSGLFGALTVAIAYFLFLKLHLRRVVCVCLTLVYTFSTTLWKVSVIAEVYALYAFFAALTLFLLILWREKRLNKFLYLAAFVYGLGLTNHLLITFLMPGILYFLWITDKRVFLDIKQFSKVVACMSIGLVPYIYLPIRGLQGPLLDWGNPVTLKSLIRLVTGGIYKTSKFTLALIDPLGMLKYNFGIFVNQFTFVFSIFSLWGIYRLFKENIKFLIFLGVAFLGVGLYSLNIQEKVMSGLIDQEAYYLPCFLIVLIFIGYGLNDAVEWTVSKRFKPSRWVWVILCILPIIVFASHYRQANMSRYYFAYDYGTNILHQLPQKSILFNQVDYNVLPLWYLQYVEKQRFDVPVFTVLFLTRDWFVERLLKLYPEIKVTCSLKEKHTHIFENIIYNNRDTHPIYFTHDFLTQKEEINPPPLVKEGIINKLKEQPLLGDKFRYNYRGVFDKGVQKDVWADEVMLVYSYYHAELGQRYQIAGRMDEALEELNMAVKIDPRNVSYQAALAAIYNAKGEYNQAIEVLEAALQKNSKSPDIYYNLGLTYYYQKNYPEALVQLEKGVKLAPQDTNLLNVLGLCYHLNGRQQEAISTLQKALAIAPDSVEIRRNLELVISAR